MSSENPDIIEQLGSHLNAFVQPEIDKRMNQVQEVFGPNGEVLTTVSTTAARQLAIETGRLKQVLNAFESFGEVFRRNYAGLDLPLPTLEQLLQSAEPQQPAKPEEKSWYIYVFNYDRGDKAKPEGGKSFMVTPEVLPKRVHKVITAGEAQVMLKLGDDLSKLPARFLDRPIPVDQLVPAIKKFARRFETVRDLVQVKQTSLTPEEAAKMVPLLNAAGITAELINDPATYDAESGTPMPELDEFSSHLNNSMFQESVKVTASSLYETTFGVEERLKEGKWGQEFRMRETIRRHLDLRNRVVRG